MPGRPRKPIALVEIDGDRRKIGAKKHEQRIRAAKKVTAGMPEMPAALQADKSTDEAGRRLLTIARAHWRALADGLHRARLIAEIDEGMLTTTAMTYAHMIVAGRSGNSRALADLAQRYMQAADRMGLNASARAKFAEAPNEKSSLEDMVCA